MFAYITLDKPPGDPEARKLPGSRVAAPRQTTDREQYNQMVQEIAPGFGTRWAGPQGLAIVAEYAGRDGVLRTTPIHRLEPCLLQGKIAVPEDKKTRLVLAVSHEPKGAWDLTVKADGKPLHQARIGGSGGEPRWHTISVDLTPLEGRTVSLELIHASVGKGPDAAYWAQVETVSD